MFDKIRDMLYANPVLKSLIKTRPGSTRTNDDIAAALALALYAAKNQPRSAFIKA